MGRIGSTYLSRTILFAVLMCLLSTAPTVVAHSTAALPVPIRVAPVADRHLPSLHLAVSLSPNPVAVGDTITATVTVTNESANPAHNLIVSLPVPEGTVASPSPALHKTTLSWRWTQPLFAAHHETSYKATFRLIHAPVGKALLLHPQVTARGLSNPIEDISGAVVIDSGPAKTATAFTPGSPALVRSGDGMVTVHVPAAASTQALTLNHSLIAAQLTDRRATGKPIPPENAAFKRGFPAFSLTATSSTQQDIHQFAAPLTITVQYTLDQLAALNIAEPDLTLFWFDTAQSAWQPLLTTIDYTNHSASATVDHFSDYQLSDGSSPSAAFLPTLQGGQVDMFTGSASYSVPIDVPAGPGGVKPGLELSYSSAATDGATGYRLKQQAGWAGKGWSLPASSVSLNKLSPSSSTQISTYTVALNGQSFTLTGTAIGANPDPSVPTDYTWNPTSEAYLKVQVTQNGVSYAGRGGKKNNAWLPRYQWDVWTKDGTHYSFTEDAWWGWDNCTASSSAAMETYKWMLSTITDLSGNTITYSYNRANEAVGPICQSVGGTDDYDIWPNSISWGHNTRTGVPDRYRVLFNPSTRSYDTQYEQVSNQLGKSPHETQQLDTIQVQSNSDPGAASSAWQLVRQYNLSYGSTSYVGGTPTFSPYYMYPDVPIQTGGNWQANTSYRKLGLIGVQQLGSDGVTALPQTQFSYGTAQDSTNSFPNGDFMRLNLIDNGQHGTISLTYDNVGTALGHDGHFNNFRRVLSKTQNPGIGASLTTSYHYYGPQINTLGTALGGWGPSSVPTSAALYFNKYFDTLHSNIGWLATKAQQEFRGHDHVIEIGPDGTQTTHWFYQGMANQGLLLTIAPTNTPEDSNCTYPQSGGNPVGGTNLAGNVCFQQMRNHELLKGREYKTTVQAPDANGALHTISQTIHTGRSIWLLCQTCFNLTGLGRSFVYEARTELQVFDPNHTPDADPTNLISRTTQSVYDLDPPVGDTTPNPNYDGGTYGNLSYTEEYDAVTTPGSLGSPLRITQYKYAIATNGAYIVDRVYQTAILDGQGNYLGLSHTFYDSNTVLGMLNTACTTLLTTCGTSSQTRVYFDVPKQTTLIGLTLHSRDDTFTVDNYGNRTSTITYTAATGSLTAYSGAGTAQWNGSNWVFGISTAAGTGTNGSRIGLISAVSYDTLFNAFPVSTSTPPLIPGNSGSIQTSQVGYDFRMGLATSSSDANNTQSNPTTVYTEYDVLGRQIKLIKPGDTSAAPTTQMYYYTAQSQYFVYRVDQRAVNGGQTNIHSAYQFYDGMGRVIQTKSQSHSTRGTIDQSIVTDNIYGATDGFGFSRINKTSQQRYVTESSTSIGSYTNIPSSGMNWTVSTANSLAATVTAPDGTFITTLPSLDVANVRVVSTTIDADSHRIDQKSDGLGRVREVVEYTGNGSSQAYTIYATTHSNYDNLNRLVSTTDNSGNSTNIVYDSLGRKTQGSDPDLGTWMYQYDVNGNLLQQTDAKGQIINFSYDALERPLARTTQQNGQTVTLGSYMYDQGTNGIGRRTGTSNTNPVSGYTTALSSVQYDARGRVTQTTLTINTPDNSTSRTHVYNTSYDSGDRVQTTTLDTNGMGPETLSYTYDDAWRQMSLHTSTSDVGNGQNYTSIPTNNTYTALGHLQQMNLGNGVNDYWTYSSTMQRMTETKIMHGSSALMDRTYDSYDPIGNITALTDHVLYSGTTPQALSQTQSFSYDELNRLVTVTTTGSVAVNAPPVNESYGYDVLGNMTNKAGVNQSYPSAGNTKPHAVMSVAGQGYTYDANGNILSGGGRVYLNWNSQNMPTEIVGTDGIHETYTYDADGQRVTRTRQGVTTLYFGANEEDINSSQTAIRTLYSFAGTVIQRSSVTSSGSTISSIAYLHSDNLGSIGLTTDASGNVISQQNFDPWGKLRGTPGGLNPTKLSYTGQKLDDTGLLFYNARYYDPTIGRFLSPDTITPSADSQSRNRYTYVNNNPINATDPTGHCVTEDVGKPYCGLEDKVNHGNHIDGIEKWDINQLNDMLKWLTLGNISFMGSWTATKLDAVRQSLDRMFNAFSLCQTRKSCKNLSGSPTDIMKKALGLTRGGSLIFNSIQIDPDNPGAEGETVCQNDTCTVTLTDVRPMGPYDAAETVDHEFGHVLSWQLGNRKYKYADSLAWTSAVGWELRDVGSGQIWILNRDPEGGNYGGAISTYATSSPGEDFAESFAWWINTFDSDQYRIDYVSGLNNRNPSGDLDTYFAPNQARQDAISAAVNLINGIK